MCAEETKECYDCHQKEKETFSKGTFHPPVAHGDCKVCHKDHGDKNNLILQFEVEKELCFTCHDKKGEKNSVHRPIRDGKCTGCHNPHNSVNEYFLKNKVSELCLSCHKKNAEENYLHTPYKEGKCLDCHDPHESNNSKLMSLDSGKTVAVISDLCIKCHQKIIQGKNIHLIVMAGECLSCHRAHSSKYQFQLVEPLEKICYLNCHKNFGKDKDLHKPVKEGKCVSCHDPHNSPNSKLLLPKEFTGAFKEDKLCYLCHPNMRQKYSSKIHKPITDGDCDGCHVPHGSENKKLLKFSEDKDMCLSCHRLGPEDLKNKKHTLDQAHTKCLGCHNPHGN
ncbi:MAG: cytochrome c3 family protein [bacterium]|nr:cytochrome c3 family protein [bacterium]